MQEIQGINELFPSTAPVAKGSAADEMGMEDFLTLMVAQLENQDPSKPMENTDFLGQIAQFSTVSGIEGLQTSFADLSGSLYANQAVEAASLVGRQVITNSNVALFTPGESIGGTIDLPANTSQMSVYVQDMSGALVYSQTLGPQGAGEQPFSWDGTNGDGDMLDPGRYRISAEALIDGATQAVSVYSHQRVESVSVGNSGASLTMNLKGGGSASMTDVRGFL
jgi:flagellar basal-body rod modification protein FlgD